MSREDILRALRDEFRSNTRDRLVEMSELLGLLVDEPDENQLRVLERHFHGLAGLGGTYGYQSVTSMSREGEDVCAGSAPSPSEADIDRLRRILAALEAAIEEAPDSE